MRTKIYQINSKRDVNCVKFEGLDLLKRHRGSSVVDPSIYDEVFNAEIDETDPEAIYQRFNTVGHPLHRGHSLSVSDVVVNDNGAFFCDSIGFLPIMFDESQTQKSDNLMRVVYVEPHKAPYIAEIAHTLEAEQKAVGDGLIEPIDNDDGTCLVGNEESKLRGMDGNRRIGDGTSIMAGPFFVCGDSGESFRSLTDEEVTKYMTRFADPEDISPEEVEADMSNQLLGQGKTAASIDELYLFLTNMTAIEYIRNAMKRVRKKDSSIILASQNIEDFLIPSIREFTKPLFSIPTHQFLFNAGQINPKEYMDALQVEPSEFELIKYPERGTCLFRCGNERYLLQVIAPDYKAALFGKAGGR